MQGVPPFLRSFGSTYASLLVNVVEFLAISVSLYLAGRVAVSTVGRVALERGRFDETTASGVVSFMRVGVLLIAVVVAASAADFRGALAGSAIVAAGVTLAVGLAAQDVLANFVAGAFLVQDPDVNVGDRVRWGEDDEGIVESIDLRVTRIQTLDNDVIVVPNSELSTTVLRNLTARDPVGFSVEFAVQHDQVGEAIETLERVARDQPELLGTPGPTVRVTGLLESEVVVTARAFFPVDLRSQRYRIRTTFLRNAVERCRAAGIDLNQSSLQEVSGRLAVDRSVERDPDRQSGDRSRADGGRWGTGREE